MVVRQDIPIGLEDESGATPAPRLWVGGAPTEEVLPGCALEGARHLDLSTTDTLHLDKIGRASCRERVKSSVVGVGLKRKRLQDTNMELRIYNIHVINER